MGQLEYLACLVIADIWVRTPLGKHPWHLGLPHDSAAALIVEGGIVAAALE